MKKGTFKITNTTRGRGGEKKKSGGPFKVFTGVFGAEQFSTKVLIECN